MSSVFIAFHLIQKLSMTGHLSSSSPRHSLEETGNLTCCINVWLLTSLRSSLLVHCHTFAAHSPTAPLPWSTLVFYLPVISRACLCVHCKPNERLVCIWQYTKSDCRPTEVKELCSIAITDFTKRPSKACNKIASHTIKMHRLIWTLGILGASSHGSTGSFLHIETSFSKCT